MQNQADDAALVARLLARDEAAFRALVERHHGAMVRVAMLFVGNRATAEEVVQETWLAVLGRLREFECRSSFKTWIFRILSNRAKTRGVRERRAVPFSAMVDASSDEPAVDPARFKDNGMWATPPHRWSEETPEALLMRHEAVACIEAALAELPPQQRAVVTLHDLESMTSEEVCAILEISEGNQRVLLHRGRSKIRQALERALGT